MKETDSIRVTLSPSNLVTGWLAGLHAATVLPLWWAALPLWASVTALVVIGAHGAWVVSRYGRLQRPRSITGVALRLGQDCTLVARDGSEFAGTVDPSTLVTISLVVLVVRASGARRVRRAIVASDMLAADDFRRLRVGLKWGGSQEPDSNHA